MATQLTVTNEALRIIGEPSITDVAVNLEAARQMAAVFEDCFDVVMEQAQWNFARYRVQLSQVATAPNWGFKYYYALPSDWVRTILLSPSGQETDSITQYQLENGMIACDEETLYLYYVSSSAFTNTGAWPSMFAKWVSAEMARAVAPRLNPAAIKEAEDVCKLWQKMAKNSDQIKQPPKLRRSGLWASARRIGSASSSEQF